MEEVGIADPWEYLLGPNVIRITRLREQQQDMWKKEKLKYNTILSSWKDILKMRVLKAMPQKE